MILPMKFYTMICVDLGELLYDVKLRRFNVYSADIAVLKSFQKHVHSYQKEIFVYV